MRRWYNGAGFLLDISRRLPEFACPSGPAELSVPAETLQSQERRTLSDSRRQVCSPMVHAVGRIGSLGVASQTEQNRCSRLPGGETVANSRMRGLAPDSHRPLTYTSSILPSKGRGPGAGLNHLSLQSTDAPHPVQPGYHTIFTFSARGPLGPSPTLYETR
jgi:hypothetical protein